MVVYMENALKIKPEGLKIKERLASCSQFVQLVRIIQRNILEASADTSLGRTHPTHPRFFIKGGDLEKVWNPNYNQMRIYIKVVSEKPPNEEKDGSKEQQKDYQSKFAKDMHNFHHGDGNGFNAYVRNNHGNGNFTSKRYNGVGNFSSDAKPYGHTSYDDYGGYEEIMLNMIILSIILMIVMKVSS
ncbi:hypothetical protein M9H77_23404 [Catharanthus roseus]|uniref:Uncharacterized protein n=1 Tax=Catharanthus roseus TaxID=4058 RepID=A0ACC0AXA0_CATRO|nr:hypothetical protein M9H77_23404 [Catharanthus roseus]